MRTVPPVSRPRPPTLGHRAGRCRDHFPRRSTAAQDASATPPATANTEGQAPIFFASGCDPANAATYTPLNAAAVFVPAFFCHPLAATAPAAASAAPPNGRFLVQRATP
ncbi:hypothetical protein SL103_01365 [Streptomyces lydicus]|uniref:Uncharacterized protein n=1 Tax=Streptomyces lydicus TaxID=47763 RepID=A0A1D7VES3_9ACTN|nr:hypothetical protein SL103_01365 [Streptomyces lydicus]